MILYTDGACKTSDNTGGWAFILTDNDERIGSDFGPILNTTNNRMEIQSVIEGLKYCIQRNVKEVVVVSDSMYVIGTMSKNWTRRKNIDLWEELDKLINKINVTWEHTKGHSGDKWNEKCDLLAVTASNYLKI